MKLARNAILVAIFIFLGCATMGQKPWYYDIKNWNMYQKANFFMSVWLAEKHSYDTMNTMEDKPEAVIEILKAKAKILEAVREPIRIYVQSVKAGGMPDIKSEQEIISWLIQLQQQVVYGR